MLFVCQVHARVWRCVKCNFLVMFTLIIVSFGTSLWLCEARCVHCFLRVFMIFAMCCEFLATRLYLESFDVRQFARRHVCFCHFLVGCFCQC